MSNLVFSVSSYILVLRSNLILNFKEDNNSKMKLVTRPSKSLGKDHWEDLVWSESMSKFPAYEKVALKHPGFLTLIFFKNMLL